MPSSLSRRGASCACAGTRGIAAKKTVTTRRRTTLIIHPLRIFRRPSELFVTNGLDRIESRRFDRWIDAKNQTNRNGNHECQKDGADGHDGGPSGQPRDELRHGEPEDHTHKPPAERDQHGFDDKLADDVPAPRADSAAHADLARARANGGQPDVHDPDYAAREEVGW